MTFFPSYIIHSLLVDFNSLFFRSDHRAKLALAAAFVHATDSRYGFSSKDLRKLGGSELSRIGDLIGTDHGMLNVFINNRKSEGPKNNALQ